MSCSVTSVPLWFSGGGMGTIEFTLGRDSPHRYTEAGLQMVKKIVLALIALLVFILVGTIVFKGGPADFIGSLRYGGDVRDGDLDFGDAAPEVMVTSLDGADERPLTDRFGIRPVVLAFGSYTSPAFRQSLPRLQNLAGQFEGRVQMVIVYIKEAHADDEWQVDENREMEIAYRQPTTMDERLHIASQFASNYDLRLPIVVDAMDNAAGNAYAAWPVRLYVVDEAGTVVYKSRPGENGFDVMELGEFLDTSLPQVLEDSQETPEGATPGHGAPV